MKKFLFLLAVSSSLSACSSNFEPGPDLTLQSNYKFHKQKPNTHGTMNPDTKWWANFGDPTLNSLIEEALASNISVEQARERIRSARFNARIVKGAYYPTLTAGTDGSVGQQTTWSKSHLQPARTTSETNNASAGLSALWTLDMGIKPSAEQQRALVEAQKETLNATRLDIIAGMTSAYLNVQGLGREIVIARKSLAVQNNTAEITKAKLDAGSVSALDSTRATAAAALTASDIPTLEQAQQQAINQIAILLGKEPAAVSSGFSSFKAVRYPRIKFSEGIPADLLSNRPDVRVAQWQLKAAMSGIGVAEADQYPSLQLSGTLTASATQLSRSQTTSWGFGPSINIPIFQGGRVKANINLSKSDARVQYLTYRQTVLSAVQDVENALIAVRSEQARHAKLAIAVADYTKAEQLAVQLNESGTTEFRDVLDAQSDLYNAELQLAISALQVNINYVALCQALGGGWYGDEPVMDEDTIALADKAKRTTAAN